MRAGYHQVTSILLFCFSPCNHRRRMARRLSTPSGQNAPGSGVEAIRRLGPLKVRMVRLTNIPKQKLKSSQMITIGANPLDIFDMPRGCIKNRRISMPQLVPTIIEVDMSLLTILRLYRSELAGSRNEGLTYPWIAPRTDCAGVRMPSRLV